MAQKQMDLTCGQPVRGILRFSLPLVLGNLFQQMYSIVDAVIIGQYCGVEALAAVSCTSWFCWLVNALCRDSGNAFGIMGSIRAGRQEEDEFRCVVANAIVYGLAISVLVTVTTVIALNGIVAALHVPDNILNGARDYLLIYVLGIPPMLIFNLASSLLRAIGNSSVTMTAMIASTIVNIVLDLLFVVGFGWGIPGAGWATFLSIVLSAVIAVAACWKSTLFQPTRKHYRADQKMIKEIASLLFPMLLNSTIIAVGGMVVLSSSNLLGSSFAAGRAAEGKIFGLLEAVIMAFQTGVSIFVGQNLGARKIDRIHRGFHQSLVLVIGLFILMAAGVLTFQEPILNLFLSKENPVDYAQALRVGKEAIRCVLLGMCFMTPMYLYRVAIQTLGHAEFSMIAGIGQVFARVLTITLGPSLIGIYAYYFTDGMAWAISLPIVAIPYYTVLHRLKNETKCAEAPMKEVHH